MSLDVIQLLLPLYSEQPSAIAAHLEEFFTQHEAELQTIYSEQREVENVSAFLFQPEALMIYDRLEADELSTRTLWNTKYPEEELEPLANTFGISFD